MEPSTDAITVTIGIFSGRPNPQLTLSGPSAQEFANLVNATLGKDPIHPPPQPKLGFYYGFSVQTPRELATRLALPTDLYVYYGVVTQGTGREQRHWRDVANVERFLIQQAHQQGHGELLDKVSAPKPR